jgi:hypothetical protein
MERAVRTGDRHHYASAVADLWQRLGTALANARDATSQVSGAIEDCDDDAVERLLPEWRGALFRVRLARLRALERYPLELPDAGTESRPARRESRTSLSAVAATGLVLAGALLFTAGAVLAAWPLWAAGLALFAGGFILFRP